MSPEIVMAQAQSTAPPFEGLHGPESPPSSGTDGSNAVEATAGSHRTRSKLVWGFVH
jgi:hypothetical protein